MQIVVVEALLPTIRSHLMDSHGAVLRSARRQIQYEPASREFRELPPEAFLQALHDSVEECVAHATSPPDLIAVTGYDDGLLLVSDNGQFRGPVITGDDTRALPLLDQWIDSGIAAAGLRRSGSAPATGSASTLLRWLLDDEPERIDRSFLASNAVTGTAACFSLPIGASHAVAPHQVFDPHRGAYDEELIDLYRLRPVRHLLPQVGNASAPFEPSPGLASLIPFVASDTLVHAGTNEAMATWQATGAAVDGDAAIYLGRSLIVSSPVNRVDNGAQPGGLTIQTDTPQVWLRVLTSSSGMAALDWLLALTGAGYQDLNRFLEVSPPGANGVAISPAMNAARERGTFVDPRITGRMSGLSEETTRADLARGVCEGIAYSARHALVTTGYAEERAVRFCGGGVRAPAFRQLLADVLQRPVLVDPTAEPVALGAAIVACRAFGRELKRNDRESSLTEVLPNPALRTLSDDGFRHYLEMVTRARTRL